MEPLSAGLWKQWQARDEDDKFILVCVVHNAFATGWLRDFAKDWVKAGALRIAPISAQSVPTLTPPRCTRHSLT